MARPKIINAVLYLLAAGFFFVFWLFVVFPDAAVEARLMTEIQNRLGSQYKINAESTDFSLWGSLTLRKLQIADASSSTENILLKTPQLKLKFSPWQLLTRNQDFDFYLQGTGKGSATGSFAQGSDSTQISAEFDRYALSDLQILANKLQVSLQGVLNGDFKIDYHTKEVQQNQGKIDLKLSQMTVDLKNYIDLPPLKLASEKGSVIKGEVKKEELTIQDFILNGPDLELQLKGRVFLKGKSPLNFRYSLEGTVKISEAFEKQLEAKLGPLLQAYKELKNPAGAYPISFSGRLSGKPEIKIGRQRLPI